jgi:hypothetical protein
MLAAMFPSVSPAAITVLREYHLGEAGSITGGLPQDAAGNASFTGTVGTAIATSTSSPSPVSTAYASFGGGAAFGADMVTVPLDNFAVEMWVRVSNDAQSVGIFSMGRRADGNLRFHVENGYWAASYKGLGWIGSDPINSPASSQAITENLWTHLAVIRANGISTFYINGDAQSGTSSATPVHETGRAHIGVFNQSPTYFSGDVDELRVFTFDALSDDPVSALSVSSIPEPSSLLVIGLSAMAFTSRRRR